MERRDLLKLLSASLGGASLAACAKDAAAPTSPLEGTLAALPNSFALYPLIPPFELRGISLDHYRLDCSVTGQDGMFISGVETSGAEALYFVQVDFSGPPPPAPVYVDRMVKAGDRMGGRTVLGVHNYDCNTNGDVGVILSFADPSASAGGPPTTREVWLHHWGGSWERLLYDGFVTAQGDILTGLFDDIDVHTNCDMLVTGWYRAKSTIVSQRAATQDPNIPDAQQPQQAVFSISGGNASTLAVELRDDQLQATDGGVASLGLIDMHDGGHFALQAFPGRLRGASGLGASGTSPVLIQGRVGAGARGAVPLTAPAGGTANPLFSILGGPSGDAYYGPRVGPNGQTAYILVQPPAGTVLYLGSQRVIGTGDCIPGFGSCNAGDYGIAAVNPPVFGNRGEIYFVAECPNGAFLCASNGYHTNAYYPRVNFPQFQSLATSVALGHLTDSIDPSGRLYCFTMLNDGTTTPAVAIPS